MKWTKVGSWFAMSALAIQMSGRILTPNGDGINDSIAFDYPSSMTATPMAHVFDIRGRRITDLAPVSATQLRWDGRDSAGRIVESGVYVVQISEESSLWNGVVSVAK